MFLFCHFVLKKKKKKKKRKNETKIKMNSIADNGRIYYHSLTTITQDTYQLVRLRITFVVNLFIFLYFLQNSAIQTPCIIKKMINRGREVQNKSVEEVTGVR